MSCPHDAFAIHRLPASRPLLSPQKQRAAPTISEAW